MKKGIIIYQSKYGATKKYAEWLRTITGFDCSETPKAVLREVLQYDTVILCGGVYASGIAGLSFFKKNIASLKNKKLAVLCVGASPYDEAALAQNAAKICSQKSPRFIRAMDESTDVRSRAVL